MKYTRTTAISMALATSLITACIEDQRTPFDARSQQVMMAAASDPAPGGGTPVGIGGSYTITAGGDYVKAIDLTATGMQVPQGVPVRVTITGEISVAPTPGLLVFCQTEFFYPLCTGQWADLINLRSIPPSGAGIDWWPGTGNILVSWNGGAPSKPDAGGNSVLPGPAPAAAEVWAGREQFGCWFDDDITHTGSGACFSYGGGFTVTVQPEDGSDPGGGGGGGGGGGDPKLRVSVDLQEVGPHGGVVNARALIAEGSSISDERWYFVPDSIGTQPGDTITVPDPMATSATTAVSRAEGVDAQSQSASSVLSSAFSPQPSSAQPFGAAASIRILHVMGGAPIGSVTACDDVESCDVSVPRGGTIVLAATVDGVALSASQHIDAGATPAATLKLECTGSVTRGQTAICTASVDPAETRFTVTAWSFTPSSGTLGEVTRPNDVNSTTWSGHMATSGTVQVTATVAGATQTKSATIEVTPRTLTSLGVAMQIIRSDPGDLPPRPTAVKQLGHTYYESKVNADNTFEVIGDGPNTGLVFFTAVPVTMEITVHVNTAALAVGSEFWHLQDPPTSAFRMGTFPCTRDDVTRAIPQIAAHEGIERTSPNSHVKEFMDLFEPEARAFFEPIVAAGTPPGPLDDLRRISAHARDVSGPRVDKSLANPFHLNCFFKYF
jgi:hypothetical protein